MSVPFNIIAGWFGDNSFPGNQMHNQNNQETTDGRRWCLRWQSAFGLTETFDLFISESNLLIFVPNCTEVVNLKKNSHKQFLRHSANKLLAYDDACALFRSHGGNINTPKAKHKHKP